MIVRNFVFGTCSSSGSDLMQEVMVKSDYLIEGLTWLFWVVFGFLIGGIHF